MPWRTVGEHVRRTRALRRQTQAEFALEVGLSVRTVGSLEAGEARQYDETTVFRVESALGWAPGSVQRVIHGQKPIVQADPWLARILDAWPRLDERARQLLSEFAVTAAGYISPDDDPPAGDDTSE